MKSFRANFKLNDPKLLTPVKEFPGDATVVMQTLWPNLIVQQQSNTLAMRQLVTRGPDTFDLSGLSSVTLMTVTRGPSSVSARPI